MNGTVKRPNHDYRRDVGKQNNKIYVYGNTVQQMNAAPARRSAQTRVGQRADEQRRNRSSASRRSRIRARQVTMPYAIFLGIVALMTLGICINYVQLKSSNTAYRSELIEKENDVSRAKMLNDATYEKVLASVDLEYVREVAINKLGMVYAQEGQIIPYSSQDSDYMRQYSDVPTE